MDDETTATTPEDTTPSQPTTTDATATVDTPMHVDARGTQWSCFDASRDENSSTRGERSSSGHTDAECLLFSGNP
jgi:hypothetical protein